MNRYALGGWRGRVGFRRCLRNGLFQASIHLLRSSWTVSQLFACSVARLRAELSHPLRRNPLHSLAHPTSSCRVCNVVQMMEAHLLWRQLAWGVGPPTSKGPPPLVPAICIPPIFPFSSAHRKMDQRSERMFSRKSKPASSTSHCVALNTSHCAALNKYLVYRHLSCSC